MRRRPGPLSVASIAFLWSLSGSGIMLSAQEREAKPPAAGRRPALEVTGEAVLRSVDEHHVLLAVSGTEKSLYMVETEGVLDASVLLRSRACEVYRTGSGFIAAFPEEAKLFVVAMKGTIKYRKAPDFPRSSRNLEITLIDDAVSLAIERGAPLNLDEIEAGVLPEGKQNQSAAGTIVPQNQYPGGPNSSGSCPSSCSAGRQNVIPLVGADSCSISCVPPKCASCSQDSSGVSCYCYLPPPV